MNRLLVALLVTLLPLGAGAQTVRDSAADSMDFSDKATNELAVKLPDPPRDENLVPFDARPWTTLACYVDAKSVSVGEDEVVRFTSVIKSDSGAKNVIYEGIRCTTRERKVFAYGSSDGKWSEVRDAKWTKIGLPATEGYRFVLYQDFFCAGRARIKNAAEAVAVLKRGSNPDMDSWSRGAPLR